MLSGDGVGVTLVVGVGAGVGDGDAVIVGEGVGDGSRMVTCGTKVVVGGIVEVTPAAGAELSHADTSIMTKATAHEYASARDGCLDTESSKQTR
jgi:hypothetical protein